MGNVKAKFRGESSRLDLTEGIKALEAKQLEDALKNQAVIDWMNVQDRNEAVTNKMDALDVIETATDEQCAILLGIMKAVIEQ